MEMKGNNELRLNEATLIEAVQEWLDRKWPKDSPRVTAISLSASSTYDGGPTFTVKMSADEFSKEAGIATPLPVN